MNLTKGKETDRLTDKGSLLTLKAQHKSLTEWLLRGLDGERCKGSFALCFPPVVKFR